MRHLHFDHLQVLGMYSRLFQKEAETMIYVPTKDCDAVQALDGLYSPLYWPLSLTEYGGIVQILPHCFPLQIGGITVDGMELLACSGARQFFSNICVDVVRVLRIYLCKQKHNAPRKMSGRFRI